MKIFLCRKGDIVYRLTNTEIISIKPTIHKNGNAILVLNYYDSDGYHVVYCDRIDTITEKE